MGLLSALIPGGDMAMGLLNIGGDIFNSERGYHENHRNLDKSFEYSSALAAQQHEYEKEKMQNAYQWTMKDLQASGLNPTLMMGGGGSATIAGGSGGAAVSAPSSGPANIDVASALKLTKELNLMDKEADRIDSETNQNNANSGKLQQDAIFTMENTKLVKKQIEESLSRSRLNEAERQKAIETIDILLKQEQKISEEIEILKSQRKTSEINAKFAKAVAIQQQITGYLNSITGGINAIKGTSALPMNIHSNSSSAVYHQPFNLH